MSRIDLHIVGTANFAQAEASIARLKAQIASLNSMGMISPAASSAMQSTFANALNASGMFQARMTNLTSETEKFGRALERGNLRGMQYFRAGSEYLRKQQGQIRALAKEQVRMQQTRGYGFGDGKAVAVTPRDIDGAIHKQQILNEQHRIFRQVVQGGATQLINWGKNTQWAGRQLTVGLTVPLTIFGTVAGKMFMDMDKQLTRMVKVYGDASKGAVNISELQKIRGEVAALSQEIASSMGIAATETAGVAADIAATGKQGEELLSATREAMRLSVLGEVDRQEAMRATLALQSSFGKSTQGLTESINFLNAVENQTSTTLNDLVEGIVKAGPVVRGLGGDVEELALMMVAMREGGIPASEAANAIKSSLASLINPTKQTTQVLGEFGVDIKDIVDRNAGDVIGTLMDLQEALSQLDDLSRQRSIEQIFGKFQFSRINALLSNLNKAGGQTQQVMELAGMSTVQLAETADRELKLLTESASGRFTRAVEGLKASLIPIGETFIELGTNLLNFAKGIIDAFNDLPGPIKSFVKFIGLATALAGPLIMMVGIFGNFFGYIVKTAGALLALRKGARGVFEYYTAESVAARNMTELVSAGMYDQTKATQSLKAAIDSLSASLSAMAANMNNVGSASMNAAQAANVMAGSARNAAVSALSGAQGTAKGGSESKGYLLWHQTPKAGESAQGKTLLYGTRAVPSSMGEVNSTLRDYPFPVLSGNRDLDRAAIERYRQAASRSGQASLSAAEIASSAPNYKVAARQSAGMVGRAQIEAELVQSGMSSKKAVDALGAYSKTALTDPVKAINELQQSVGKAGINIRTVVDNLTREFEETYLAAIKSGKTIEEATKAAYARMKTLEQQAITQGASGAYLDPKTGGVAKRGAVTAGVMLSDDALRRANLSAMTAEEQAQTTGRQALRRGMGDRQIDPRTMALQQQINAVEEQRIAAKRALFANEEKIRVKTQELTGIQTRLSELEKQKLRFTSDSSADRMATAVIDQQIRDLATKEQALRRSIGQGLGSARTKISNQLEEQTARKRALEVQREVSMRKALTAQIMQGANVEREARGSIAAALRTESSSVLKRVTSLEQISIAEKNYYSLLNKHGQTIALVDASSQRVIRGQEMVALKWTQLTGEVSKEISSMTMSSFARRKLDVWMNSLSNQVREQAVSHELVQQANGKYIIALKTAEGKILAQSQAFNSGRFGGRLGGGAMGAGMVAGMGTMFLPMGGEDNTGANVAGGALMGASMGAMLGSMAAPGIGTVVGLVGGAVAGAALPAIQAYQKNQQQANDALVKYAEALNGSSVVLDQFSTQMGRLKPSEKLTTELGNLPLTPEEQAAGQQILQTEAGQSLLETAKMFGGEQLKTSLLNQLQQLTLMEIFTPEEAKSVAQMLAVELGDPTLGRALLEGLGTVIDDEGKVISDKVAETFMKTIPDIAIPEITDDYIQKYADSQGYGDFLKDFGTGLLLPGVMPDVLAGDITGNASTLETQRAVTQFAQENLPLLASQLDKLREAQALTTQEFMSGKITYEEYSSMMEDIQKKNIYAADSIMKMKEAGADVGALLKDIADMGGRGEDYTKIEEIGKGLYDALGVGERFLSQLQLGAAYGDVTVGAIQEFANLAADPEMAVKLTAIFDTAGGEDNALEIIKMIQMGVDPELLLNITTNAEQIGKPLSDVYGLVVSISGLPDNIKKSVLAEVESDPAALQGFIDQYEYINSLPMDNLKKLKAEVFGNPELSAIAAVWEDFINLPEEERKTAIVNTLYNTSYSYDFPSGPGFGSADMSEFTSGMDASSIAQSTIEDTSGGGSSGGSSGADTKAIEEKYDTQIKAQQELIDKINEERDARQKVLDVQKQAMDFALRESDLQAQISRAKAEGDLAKAALLQGQLESEKRQYAMDEAERRRQEQEDARIKRAEEEIERLEEKKKKATESARRSGSGGSGGSSDGLSPEAQADLEKKIQFVNDRLMAAIETTGIEEFVRKIFMGGADAFWDSEPVKAYEQALKDLGVPVPVIKQQLENLFDSMILQSQTGQEQFEKVRKGLEQVGVSGESANKIISNVWTIVNDPNIDRAGALKELEKQFIEAGAEADDAWAMAKRFLQLDGMDLNEMYKTIDEFERNWSQIERRFSPEASSIISKEFLNGINKGLSDEEILNNIKRKLENAYKADIPDNIDPKIRAALIAQAEERAKTEAEAVQAWYEENPLKLPPANIEINPVEPTKNPYGTGPGGAPEPGTENGTGTSSSVTAGMPTTEDGKQSAIDVMDGYTNGIISYDTTAIQLAYDNALIKPATLALQTGSPSKVFEEIGTWSMQGFLDGINKFGTDGIAQAILGIINVVNEGMQDASITVPQMSPSGTGAGAIWASNFNSIVVEVLNKGVIPNAFRMMIDGMMATFKAIVTGESGINVTLTTESITAGQSMYDTLTQKMQETVDEINRILKTTLTDYSFDIVGIPKIYVKPGTEDLWDKLIPDFGNFDRTPVEPVKKAEGGYISGPGGPTEDKIPAMLSDGEYVIRASSVNKYGTKLLDRINAGKFADGGLVRLNPNNLSLLGEKMAKWMNQYDGVPYNKGAAWIDGPENGWGCATATRWLYNTFAGINIGHDSLSNSQYASASGSQVSDTLPGDQQFFYYANGVNVGNDINHTGVAQSANTMYHASGGTYGSYANARIDTAARSLAASRAGGTAQKRYLPETIGGMGMPIGYLKNGGMIFGQGGPTEDNILAMVSNGEFIMNAFAVKKYGKDFMDAVNNGTLAEAAAGGLISKYPSYVANMSGGGMIRKYAKGGSVDTNSNVEYNINVNVAGTNASADEIAQTVLTHLKRKERMTGAVTRV